MNKYIFLIDQNNENETIYNAIPADKIETLKVTETYDSNGQAVTPEDAGASVILKSTKAVDLANKVYHDEYSESDDLEILNHFKIDDFVSAYDQGTVYSAILIDCEEETDYILQVETCEGFNYWDGNNWKSVILSYENNDYYTGWEQLKEEALELELNNAIENCKYVSEGFGVKTYETDEYIVTQSAFASDWSTYQLTQK